MPFKELCKVGRLFSPSQQPCGHTSTLLESKHPHTSTKDNLYSGIIMILYCSSLIVRYYGSVTVTTCVSQKHSPFKHGTLPTCTVLEERRSGSGGSGNLHHCKGFLAWCARTNQNDKRCCWHGGRGVLPINELLLLLDLYIHPMLTYKYKRKF